MKRQEIEEKAKSAQDNLKNKIESDPIKAVGIGVASGFLLALLSGILIPLLLIAAAAIGVMWFVAEKEGADSATTVAAKAESSSKDAAKEASKDDSKKAKSSKNSSSKKAKSNSASNTDSSQLNA